MIKSGKLACHVTNSNIAIDTLPTLQILVGIITLFVNIYEGEPIFTIISNIEEDVQYRCFNFEKFVAARHYAIIWKQLLITNDRNRVRWVVLDFSQDRACTDLFENFSKNSLKGDQSNDTKFITPLFSLSFKECVYVWWNIVLCRWRNFFVVANLLAFFPNKV